MTSAMVRIGKAVDGSLGLVCLLGGGLIALIGLGMSVFGVYGFAVGVHGGHVIAATLTFFGAGLGFAGYLCVREGFRIIRSQTSKAGVGRGE